MAQRTIQSPGVEIFESDLSLRAPLNVGTHVYVTGFAAQGPLDEVLLISSKQDLLQIFGAPTNSAERYFHHTLNEILNSPATIYASRLPYGAQLGDGFGSKYSALAYPVTAVNNLVDNGGAGDGLQATSNAGITNSLSAGETNGPWLSSLVAATSCVYVLGAPVHHELTKSEFLSCVDGTAFTWSDAGSKATDIGAVSALGRAGLIVLNKAQTIINGNYEGYYAGAIDNTSGPGSDYDTIRNVYSVAGSGGSVTNVISGGDYLQLPPGILQFAISANYETGLNRSISEVMENLVDYDLDINEFNDVLSLGVFKLRKSVFADEAFKLDWVVEDGIVGSINYHRQKQNRRGGALITAYLENQDEFSRNVRVLVNDNLSNRLSSLAAMGGPNAETADAKPTKWIRMYNKQLGDILSKDSDSVTLSSLGNAKVGFSRTTFGRLSAAMGNPCFTPGKREGCGTEYLPTQTNGPDAGSLFALGAFSDKKVTNKKIGSLPQKIERALDRIRNDEIYDIDVVCEGGLGTIFAASSASSTAYYDEFNTDLSLQQAINTMRTSNPITTSAALNIRADYNAIFKKFANFCQPPYLKGGTRGDCIFIADVLRQILITGSNTKVLDNQELNFQKDVYWPIRHQFELANTSYACVYGNWAKVYDDWIGQQVWVPFSGFAAAAMARTDAAKWPWFAPAGFTRGLVDCNDLAINPNQKQRDEFYKNNVNPVAFFPAQGQVIFGQKTLSRKPSAFDRINVRRLFLALERPTKKAARFFVFEQNTIFTRTRLINTLTPIFENAKNNEGVYDYLIVCDERNNTPDVIDANELRVDIYIKPVRTAEFILVTFYATRTSANFEELITGYSP